MFETSLASEPSVTVIYEHADFIVVNKENGVPMHCPSSGLVSLLEARLAYPLWLLHRLDTATSGLMVLARSAQVAAIFGHLFSQRLISKYYLALVPSNIKKKQGHIIGDMQKARNGSYKLSKSTQNPAITQFYSCHYLTGLRLALLKPSTGKTHQLRVACKSLAAPILGDSRYSRQATEATQRLYLHAHMLAFSYQNQHFSFSCLPEQDDIFDQDRLQHLLHTKLDKSQLSWRCYRA